MIWLQISRWWSQTGPPRVSMRDLKSLTASGSEGGQVLICRLCIYWGRKEEIMRPACFQLYCHLHMLGAVSPLHNCTLSLKALAVAGVESYHLIHVPRAWALTNQYCIFAKNSILKGTIYYRSQSNDTMISRFPSLPLFFMSTRFESNQKISEILARQKSWHYK